MRACLRCSKKKGSSVYELCSPYYRTTTWRNTYREPIYPVGDEDEWELDEDIAQCDIGVPIERNPVGRPKKHKAGRRKENRYPCSGEKVTVCVSAAGAVVLGIIRGPVMRGSNCNIFIFVLYYIILYSVT